MNARKFPRSNFRALPGNAGWLFRVPGNVASDFGICVSAAIPSTVALMTKRLPFTAAAIARAIEGARKAGLPITATSVSPDGVVTIHHQEVPVPTVPTSDDKDDGEARDWADA
jgi:hypothetical protein